MRFLLPLMLLAAGLAAVDYESPALGAPRWAQATIPAADGVPAMRVVIHYPSAGDGPWPVVVFSHGLGGSGDGYAFLGRHWASHGIVSLHPDHPGSDTATLRAAWPGGSRAIQATLTRAVTDPVVVEGRPRQVSHVIDRLAELERQVPALAGRLDRERIGVGGHSYGAWTAMALAGQRVALAGRTGTVFADPRPRAFVALSPQGRNRASDENAWAGIARPVLAMTGSRDEQPAFLRSSGATGDTGHDGAWRAESFRFMPPGNKFLVWIEGAAHTTFADGAAARMLGEDPRIDPRHRQAILDSTLAFWDAQLRGDPRARAWLDAEGPALPGVVRVERK